jgi:hypothetical protein
VCLKSVALISASLEGNGPRRFNRLTLGCMTVAACLSWVRGAASLAELPRTLRAGRTSEADELLPGYIAQAAGGVATLISLQRPCELKSNA